MSYRVYRIFGLFPILRGIGCQVFFSYKVTNLPKKGRDILGLVYSKSRQNELFFL
jgi:hypothetical protein